MSARALHCWPRCEREPRLRRIVVVELMLGTATSVFPFSSFGQAIS